MNCCGQCQGIEELFSQEFVTRELAHYRAKGPEKTTRMLTEVIKENGVEGLTLLDIGGGLGAVQHELLSAGVEQATDVEASTAYLAAAKAEALRRGFLDRIRYHYGNFVDLAPVIETADIVTLDRVICCFPDMEQLVSLSAKRARKLYGLVYPRDTWWTKVGLALQNSYFRLRGSPFRSFVHPTKAVDAILRSNGLHQISYRRTLTWQVMVYKR